MNALLPFTRIRTVCVYVLVLFWGVSAYSQQLYHQWYGKEGSPCLVFLHGGPGYNSAAFEVSTMPALVKKGYQVLVYDQRGSGRSEGMEGEFTFAEAVADLDGLLKKRGISQANLLGHSFGGAVALHYADAFPEKTQSVVLISAPVNFPATFKSILANCRASYTAKNSPSVKYIDQIEAMDSTTLEYSSFCFAHAMMAGLYNPANPSKESVQMTKKWRDDPNWKYLAKSSMAPVQGFFDAEHYTTQDHTALLQKVCAQSTVYGIFASEDGLFDTLQLGLIESYLGSDHYHLIENASHNVFMDQPTQFLQLIGEWVPAK